MNKEKQASRLFINRKKVEEFDVTSTYLPGSAWARAYSLTHTDWSTATEHLDTSYVYKTLCRSTVSKVLADDHLVNIELLKSTI